MSGAKDTQSCLLLGEALRHKLVPLAYLVQTAQAQSSDYSFFSHLCNFVVPFIRKTPALRALRAQWTDERGRNAKENRALLRAVVKEVSEACQTLKSRLKKTKSKIRSTSLKVVEDIEKILTTGGPYLGPAFYETAADKLWSLCCTLAADGQGKLLAGIADVAYRETSSFEDGKVNRLPNCLQR